MIRKTTRRQLSVFSCLLAVAMSFSSFLIPASLRFYPMLMNKSDVATLMANSAFSQLVMVNTNLGTDDASRLSYQLAAYAYNTSNVLISPYTPLKLLKTLTDSSFSKDVYLSTYKVTKTQLSSIIPTTTYSYLKFAPYSDKTNASLANFVSYSVYPVGADGVTMVGTKSIKLNPSPPY